MLEKRWVRYVLNCEGIGATCASSSSWVVGVVGSYVKRRRISPIPTDVPSH